MANIPHRYTQEAEDERGMRKRLSESGGPKSRWSWGYNWVKQSDWDRIFGKKRK